MIKDIKYNGYTAQPSDYQCNDGDLAMSMNLIPDNGGISPIALPVQICSIGLGSKVFIHKVGSDENYISYSSSSFALKWFGKKSGNAFDTFETPVSISLPADIGTIKQLAAVGYIIIVSTSANIYYVRYVAKKNTYVFLGSKVPDLILRLALKLNFVMSDSLTTGFNVVSTTNDQPTTGDEDWESALAASYNLSGANGDIRHEWVLTEHLQDNWAATAFIPFDSAFKLLANVEYKLKWNAFTGGSGPGTTLGIYGTRNGSQTQEQIKWFGIDHSIPHTIEEKFVLDDEWTNVCYKLTIMTGSDLSHIVATGNITWYKGIDSSESGSDSVTAIIEYTSDSHEAIMGAVNKFVKEKAMDHARFMYPFFARYAVRLYDGSYSSVSEPILMVPNAHYAPAISYSKHSILGSRLILSAFVADIRYKLSSAIPEDWTDLITGIDIFVSSPVWAYDQGQEYDGSKNYFHFSKSVDSIGYGVAYYDNAPCDSTDYYPRHLKDYIRRYASNVLSHNYVQIAPRSEQDIKKDCVSITNFYKIGSLGLSELNNAVSEFADLDLEIDSLSALAARETLTDDVLPYAGFTNAYVKEYNRRLHICNASTILKSPAHPVHCFNYIEQSMPGNYIQSYVFLATDDGMKTVVGPRLGGEVGPWFYYPDARAYKVAFVRTTRTASTSIAEIDLKRHDFLNGAYWLAEDFISSVSFKLIPSDPYVDTIANSVNAASTIYVSEVNCPFVFKAVSAVSIGAQEVFAISSAAKALSQGQFGQFPLYAFTDQGIWALEMNSSGSYLARQPITRDVCINPASITQIDSAVLFASHRGIMLISGSQTVCISDTINASDTYNVSKLPGMAKLHAMMGHIDSCINVQPFLQYIAGCGMLYDYVHQRIIVYHSGYPYAYVYSLKSKEWGLMSSAISTGFNSYPEALAINQGGWLLNYSSMDGLPTKGLLVTRPLKLDAPDILKTVDTVIQRGNFQRGHVQSVLYGSRDLVNWHLVWSSKDHYMRGFRGTPYKYFRIACLTSLENNETLFGASLQFNPRQTDQPR